MPYAGGKIRRGWAHKPPIDRMPSSGHAVLQICSFKFNGVVIKGEHNYLETSGNGLHIGPAESQALDPSSAV